MARGINKVILIGNCGQDPDTKFTASGAAVTNLNIATSESWKDKQTGQMQDRTEWHRVVFLTAWLKLPVNTCVKAVRSISKVNYKHASGRIKVARIATLPKSWRMKCKCSIPAVATALVVIMQATVNLPARHHPRKTMVASKIPHRMCLMPHHRIWTALTTTSHFNDYHELSCKKSFESPFKRGFFYCDLRGKCELVKSLTIVLFYFAIVLRSKV